ncbi:hypothetical protein Salat_1968300 [Sesamum alatum]|uniref:Pectinesterase inhibitor domain-containing protein n=1 Tax=Sesamum alatum TaxID=300844 RepID=A0AAE1Y5S7_9LAMI|nr:hypothetical protein Salat_1968300 [Sesamum alatum]
MGFTKTAISSLFILLLLSTAASAAAPVSPFCGTADPGISQTMCTQMVGCAKTWPEAMTNAINAAAEKAKGGIPIAHGVGKKLPPGLLPQSKESIVLTCQEAYDWILSLFDDCRELVKDDPTLGLKRRISSMTFSDCTGVLSEFNVSVPETEALNEELHRLAGILFAVLDKKP